MADIKPCNTEAEIYHLTVLAIVVAILSSMALVFLIGTYA
jgi:hypothetical protein